MEPIASFPDAVSAEAAATLLRSHGIAVTLVPSDAFAQALSPGVKLVVPDGQARRVAWIVATSELADSESFFLTTEEFLSSEEAAAALAIKRTRTLGRVTVLGLIALAAAVAFAFVRAV